MAPLLDQKKHGYRRRSKYRITLMLKHVTFFWETNGLKHQARTPLNLSPGGWMQGYGVWWQHFRYFPFAILGYSSSLSWAYWMQCFSMYGSWPYYTSISFGVRWNYRFLDLTEVWPEICSCRSVLDQLPQQADSEAEFCIRTCIGRLLSGGALVRERGKQNWVCKSNISQSYWEFWR